MTPTQNDGVIEVSDLAKSYGSTVAVNGLNFVVHPGRVTGFLGPNGAGKSTTLRMVLGLAAPTRGTATVYGRPYRSLRRPLTHVGALLDASAVNGALSARAHLSALARSNGIGRRRVSEVLDTVGLDTVAHRRVGGFSLGMRQRLGIAAALLGDPAVLVFDEPINGLDPEGIRWIRDLLRQLAGQGRTLLVSSHLMSEMAQTADHVIVIGRGRLVADSPLDDLLVAAAKHVTVRTPQPEALAQVLSAAGARVEEDRDGALIVRRVSAEHIGDLARDAGIALHQLTPVEPSLEDAFMALTNDVVEYQGATNEPAVK